MIKMANGEWVADLLSMTCWNCGTKLLISFENDGNNLTAKIKDIPIELINRMEHDPLGKKYLKDLINEAKEAFSSAYFNNIHENAACFGE